MTPVPLSPLRLVATLVVASTVCCLLPAALEFDPPDPILSNYTQPIENIAGEGPIDLRSLHIREDRIGDKLSHLRMGIGLLMTLVPRRRRLAADCYRYYHCEFDEMSKPGSEEVVEVHDGDYERHARICPITEVEARFESISNAEFTGRHIWYLMQQYERQRVILNLMPVSDDDRFPPEYV